MSIFRKTSVWAFMIFLTCWATPEIGICAKTESKMVTRIETAAAAMKNRKMVVKVTGMATTGSLLPTSARLLRRGENFQPNKEGLLEYELHFNPPRNYSGFKLAPVKAGLTERSVPDGVKGVRVFAEFNQVDALFPQPKKKK